MPRCPSCRSAWIVISIPQKRASCLHCEREWDPSGSDAGEMTSAPLASLPLPAVARGTGTAPTD